MTKPKPTVSILCITYNHQNYIAKAIDSFIMQQTDFDFEIVIGDDCSTDGTLSILNSYKQRYPDKIMLCVSEKNGGTHQNLTACIKFCSGKYIALCEGDDYWITPFKLQKQVDFLENNPGYVICCHYTRVVNQDDETLYVHPRPVPLIHTYYDLLAGRQEETKTATVLYRNIPELHDLFKKPWFFSCYAGDKIFKLFATYYTGLKIYVIPEVMSCYRNHDGGIWSMIDTRVRTSRQISDFNLIIKNFTYPALQKKMLLLLYVKRYLLFELRQKKLNNAYHTIKYLI